MLTDYHIFVSSSHFCPPCLTISSELPQTLSPGSANTYGLILLAPSLASWLLLPTEPPIHSVSFCTLSLPLGRISNISCLYFPTTTPLLSLIPCPSPFPASRWERFIYLSHLFVFALLEIELKSTHMLSRYPSTEPYLQPHKRHKN